MRNDLLEFRIIMLYKFMGVIIDNHTLIMVKKYYFLSAGGVGVNENVYLSLSVTPQSKNRLFIYTIKDSEFCMKETCYIDNSSVYYIWLIIVFTWKIILYYNWLSRINMK